ncbi:MAG: hypothetical protein RIQ93_480 [Verrucomicrobiota bacterium]|jgi:hypothetical protein
MARHPQVKSVAIRSGRRKSAMTASAASRRPFPAWIDAAEGLAFAAKAATTRVRDALVLRTVRQKKAGSARHVSHGARG